MLSAAPRASLTLPSCSPNYLRASRIGWTLARYCPFLNTSSRRSQYLVLDHRSLRNRLQQFPCSTLEAFEISFPQTVHKMLFFKTQCIPARGKSLISKFSHEPLSLIDLSSSYHSSVFVIGIGISKTSKSSPSSKNTIL